MLRTDISGCRDTPSYMKHFRDGAWFATSDIHWGRIAFGVIIRVADEGIGGDDSSSRSSLSEIVIENES